MRAICIYVFVALLIASAALGQSLDDATRGGSQPPVDHTPAPLELCPIAPDGPTDPPPIGSALPVASTTPAAAHADGHPVSASGPATPATGPLPTPSPAGVTPASAAPMFDLTAVSRSGYEFLQPVGLYQDLPILALGTGTVTAVVASGSGFAVTVSYDGGIVIDYPLKSARVAVGARVSYNQRLGIGRTMFHRGIDQMMPVGTPLRAIGPGKVTAVSLATGTPGGRMVTIRYDCGLEVECHHLDRVLVTPGQRVEAGFVFARSGATGTECAAPHLHLQVRRRTAAGWTLAAPREVPELRFKPPRPSHRRFVPSASVP